MAVSSERQWLQIESVELADLPDLLYRSGNRLTVADGEDHFRRAPLHDLLHNECRQIIEQVYVVDSQHHRRSRAAAVSDSITPRTN